MRRGRRRENERLGKAGESDENNRATLVTTAALLARPPDPAPRIPPALALAPLHIPGVPPPGDGSRVTERWLILPMNAVARDKVQRSGRVFHLNTARRRSDRTSSLAPPPLLLIVAAVTSRPLPPA